MKGTLLFDIETHDADLLYSMEPEEFVRLIGYKRLGRDSYPRITTSLEELCNEIMDARWIIGHNIHAFDLKAAFGIRSNIPLELTDQGRVICTFTHAALAHPHPSPVETFVRRTGKAMTIKSLDQAMVWYGLDEQAYQLGVPGKTGDLKAMAKEYGGFGGIPIDLPAFREYLSGDVESGGAVAKKLLQMMPMDDYALREQAIAQRTAVISSNGWRVDVEAAEARVEELRLAREPIMETMVQKYGLPKQGKSPWASNPGKEAIFKALNDLGINEESRPNWPRTAGGSLSLGGAVLLELTKDTEAEQLGQALAELKGQRSLAQLALDEMHPDGFVHPSITMLQRSGRWSTTKPGLTVWTARGPGAVEKRYFLPDSEDDLLVAFDLSNADARAVAAMSGDKKFAERFLPGADGHLLNAWAVWGKEVVGTDKKDPNTAYWRQRAKEPGHGWGYRIGAKKLSQSTGLPLDEAKLFLDKLNAAFKDVVKWQDRSSRSAMANGYVVNEWGRKMKVTRGREFTQGPALEGQSTTREIICDHLLEVAYPVLRRVKAQVHDEIVYSLPVATMDTAIEYIKNSMARDFKPARGGQRIHFPVNAGTPAKNWHEATHD